MYEGALLSVWMILTLVVTNKSFSVMVPSSIFALTCLPWWLQTSHPMWWCHHLSLLWFLAYLSGYKQVIPCDGAIIYLCFDSLLPWWLQTSHPMWWCHHLSLLWFLAYLGGYKQVIPCDGAIIYLCFDSLLPWWLQTSHPMWWCHHLSLLWFLAYLGGYKQVIPCDGAIIYLCFDSLLPWWLQTSHPMWWCHHLSLLWFLAYLGGYKQVIPCDGAIIYLCFDSLLTLVVTNKSSRVMVPSPIFALIPCLPWWLQTSLPMWWCHHLSLLWFLAYLGGYKQVIPCDGAIIYLCFDLLTLVVTNKSSHVMVPSSIFALTCLPWWLQTSHPMWWCHHLSLLWFLAYLGGYKQVIPCDGAIIYLCFDSLLPWWLQTSHPMWWCHHLSLLWFLAYLSGYKQVIPCDGAIIYLCFDSLLTLVVTNKSSRVMVPSPIFALIPCLP